MHKSFFQKIFFVVLGLILGLIIVETTLRVSGWAYVRFQNQTNKQKLKNNSAYRILCIGESTTALGGESAYPVQLENILNEQNPDKEFVVINKGLPGVSSEIIVDNLAVWIDEYDPHIVMAMMGINDLNRLQPIEQETPFDRVKNFWLNFRVVKLLAWIKEALNNRQEVKKDAVSLAPQMVAELDAFEPQEPPLAKETLQVKDKIAQAPLGYRQLYAASIVLERKEDWVPAEGVIRKLISVNYDPEINNALYERLAHILERQEKFELFVENLSHIPFYSWGTKWIAPVCRTPKGVDIIEREITPLIEGDPQKTMYYDYLGACYAQAGETQKAKRMQEKSRFIKENYINQTTKESYAKLFHILKEKAVEAVVIQYPLRSLNNIKVMIDPSQDLPSLIFIDNQRIFEQALRQGRYEDYFYDRFAGDFGHCTALGNKLLAENIAKVLKAELFK